DITVRGNVEGAKVTAGGNIVLVGGINGMNKGLIKSGGDITSKYTENVTIDCGGNFRTDVSINCTVWAKGSIIVKGKNGAILSGYYVAIDFIYVKTVGSENRNNTNLVVQNMWYLKSREFGDNTKFDPRLNAKDIAETQKQLDNTNMVVEMIKSPSGPFTTPAERAAALKKVILMKSQLNRTMSELQKQLESFNKGKDKTRLRVICPGVIYPGGKITLDSSCIRVEHAIRNQKIYPEDGEIVYGTITSVEKEIS
ncbi:MAG: FapA family protein, partial [Oscillospiraceae bacterium]